MPLFSVLSRLNLTGGFPRSKKRCRVANVFALCFPFAISWCLNDTGAVTAALSWGGTIFSTFSAFVLPLLLTIYVVKACEIGGSVPVYWGWFTSKHSELTSLHILLALTAFAIVAAIVGNVIDWVRIHDNIDKSKVATKHSVWKRTARVPSAYLITQNEGIIKKLKQQ